MRAYLVPRKADDQLYGEVCQVPTRRLPDGDVLIAVRYSSLNYKDALAAQGHPGIVKGFPHVPGIDAAGQVVQSSSSRWPVGCEVLVTGYDLGAGRWGGWAEYIRVPADWPVALPTDRDAQWAMAMGTAGLTAALAVDSLIHEGIQPGTGPVLVTGATGGVGALAVRLLAHVGYEVAASTGKKDRHDWLKRLGASQILDRNELVAPKDKALLSARWAGAIDTVGGSTLATILRSLRPSGCVAACGLVGGPNLEISVYPFLLRGVKLIGIDSAWCPHARRVELWRRLAGEWYLDNWTELCRVVDWEGLVQAVPAILSGQLVGRTVLSVAP
ncbi:MAG: quinone oxidoreductase [Pirellulaceae bacterium]|nr:MAG: quinone oxidoreductase [Pirellulaceae bacterium]